MGNFFAELKRRQVYRVAAAYAVVAWVLLQIVNNIAPVLDLPVWVSRSSLFFLALGFPIAVFFAWMRELPSDAVTVPRATVADWSLIGVLIVVIALVSYQQFTRIQAPGVQKAGIEAGRESSALPAGAISIAVLPFENLSGDVAQEFFSDGITEEITSALAKIPDLRVVARTSAFQFKAQNRDIQSIGQQLHASHFIEGSVRKAGNRVRITAQLIEVNNGVHIWAESFDRRPGGHRNGDCGGFARSPGFEAGRASRLQSQRRCGLLPAISPRQGARACTRIDARDRCGCSAGTGCRE